MGTQVQIHSYPIRKLDVRRDLVNVADLIELCFYNQMDSEGRDYVRQIRRAARDNRYLRWIPGAGEQVSFPLHGYVWEEDEKIVGNLSLIPFLRGGKWRYLIANVAVHPDYRRHGIARRLTQRALDHIREHGVAEAWLQVRDDNEAAYNLYRSLGFVERARRTLWVSSRTSLNSPTLPTGVAVRPGTPRDWPQEEAWMQIVYPPEVTWNLPFDLRHFRPSIGNRLLRFLRGEKVRHWTAWQGDRMIGAAAWEPNPRGGDNLWLSPSKEREDLAVRALLSHCRQEMFYQRMLTVNYPAGRAELAFLQSGFESHNTLIWMEIQFK